MHRTTVFARPILPLVAILLLTACGTAQTDATVAEPTATVAAPSPTPDDAASEPAEPTDAGSEDEAAVTLTASSFSPGSLTVAVGTEVTFTNNSPLPHTVTHGSDGRPAEDAAFDRAVGEGGSVVITFDEPGIYEIYCKIHLGMQMTITVEG